ncbi:MAG: FecR domain-containing protein [Prevotella sp.]|nr:FecR domain-containing protein [Prevotella sp.]MBR1464614.1 FecR domain-containing protein [Prevotella sp.]
MQLNDINQKPIGEPEEMATPREELLVRRALLEGHSVPDAKEEFLKFKKMVVEKEHPSVSRRLPSALIKSLLAAAACLLVVFLLFNKEKKAVDMPDEHRIYIAKEAAADDITIESGKMQIACRVKPTDSPVVSEVTYEQIDLDDYVDQSTTLSVPQGKVVRISLSDGSQVWLNASSRLVYPERFPVNGPRMVKLEGEAYFHVAKDAAHPFIVDCGHVKTRVLGTQFNVKGFSGESTDVTLVEGSVEVTTKEGNVGKQETRILHPGQQLSFSGKHLSLREVDTDTFTAWHEGMFYFDNQTLREVMTEIGRWYNMNVIFEDVKYLGDTLHFSCDRSWSVQQVLTELQYITECRLRKDENSLIVY